jgi:hypothetical protein
MKTRITYTNIWMEAVKKNLSKDERYLLNYLNTSPYANKCGIYQEPDAYILIDTAFTSEELQTAKEGLQTKKLVYFFEGWVKVIAPEQYSGDYSKGEKNSVAYEHELNEIPSTIKEAFIKLESNTTIHANSDTAMDTPSILPFKELNSTSDKASIPVDSTYSYKNLEVSKGVVKGEITSIIANVESKTSKNSHTPCTEEELQEVANLLNVSLKSVKSVHDSILDKIAAGEFKLKEHKTVYYTLKDWIRLQIKKGYIQPTPKTETQSLLPDISQTPEERARSLKALEEMRKKIHSPGKFAIT